MLEFMCNITLWIQLSQKEYNTVLMVPVFQRSDVMQC